jgi:transposase
MGRRSKYTPDVVQRVTEAIRLGATYEIACQYAGISHTLFHQWMNTKVEFLEAVKESEGRGAVQWLAVIEKAAKEGTWQAAAWKLERRYNKDYGNRTTVDFNLRQEVKELAKDSGIPENVIMAEIEELVRK